MAQPVDVPNPAHRPSRYPDAAWPTQAKALRRQGAEAKPAIGSEDRWQALPKARHAEGCSPGGYDEWPPQRVQNAGVFRRRGAAPICVSVVLVALCGSGSRAQARVGSGSAMKNVAFRGVCAV